MELLTSDMIALAGEMEKKSEFATTIDHLQEENYVLVRRLQEQTDRADSLVDELAEAKEVAATREGEIGALQSRLDSALSTVESQSVDLANMRTLLPKPNTFEDTDAIKRSDTDVGY